MSTFPDVMHLFANKLAGLRARGLSFSLGFLALSKVCFSGMSYLLFAAASLNGVLEPTTSTFGVITAPTRIRIASF